jgi:DNA-binding GntR family transcriptional regulator
MSDTPLAAESAYRSLLSRITSGQLPAGAYLVENEVAATLGVSRTPVREAIRRLAADGLVAAEGRKRAIVREISTEQADELFELRARLEGYAAYRAAQHVTKDELDRLRGLAQEMERVAANPTEQEVSEFAHLNDAFHRTVLEAARAPHLTTALRPVLQVQLVLLARFRAHIGEHLERSCWHHREIIRALELRNSELAEAQMRLHLLSAR